MYTEEIHGNGVILFHGKLHLFNSTVIPSQYSSGFCSSILSDDVCEVLEMKSCSLRNLRSFPTAFSLTSNGRIIYHEVVNFYFLNLSLPTSEIRSLQKMPQKKWGADDCVIDNSFYFKVDNAYTGLITSSGEYGKTLKSMNCSFIQCTEVI